MVHYCCFKGLKFECLLCGSFYEGIRHYRKHFGESHTEYGQGRQCTFCARYFPSRRSVEEHVREKKCTGKPLVYDAKTGRLYYNGRDMFTMRSKDLCTRFANNANALIATCGLYMCVQEVSWNKPERVYSLEELPLSNADGVRPNCVARVFNPVAPVWPKGKKSGIAPFLCCRAPQSRFDMDRMLADEAVRLINARSSSPWHEECRNSRITW